jgi:hypothetical protein
MKTKTALLLVLTSGAMGPFALGCSGAASSSGDAIDLSHATLRRATSCEDLSEALRADARSKMNRRIDAEVRAIREGRTSDYAYSETNLAPQAGAASDDKSAGAASPAPAHSETETQVAGVDEADIVKADGTRLYVLHGHELKLVDAWPAPSLGVAGSTAIEGEPTEMYVADGKVVVFSRVDGAPIYASAGEIPRPGYSDAYSGGGSYRGGDATVGVAAPGPLGGGGYGGYGGGVPVANPLTKVTVLAIEGASAVVTRELYFEGSYLSSRRVDGKVRIVLEGGAHGPPIAYSPTYPTPAPATEPSKDAPYVPPPQPTTEQRIAAWEALRETNERAIDATTYTDWTPHGFSKDGDAARANATACTDFYVPTAGTTEFGMTQIVAIDLDAPTEPPREAAIVGAVETVYGDANSLVLAGRAYVEPWNLLRAYAPPRVSGGFSGPPAGETLAFTHVHLFDLARDPAQPLYLGSGTVPGTVPDQFAIEQKDGRVRVTTHEERTGPARPDGKSNAVSHVFVLENQSGRLAITGDAGEIAPGEQLYATRYVGDKAYVVTWHVTDPLFVVDLSNPHQPTVLGQLQIPGFSEYMHPLDDTHLLTIGRETDDTGHQHTSSGYWYGLAIQIFDVTQPLAPKLQQKYVYDGGEYATSEATGNHKAFTYFDDRKLLAFPYVRQSSYGTGTTATGPSSTLEVFHVDVASGIQKLGSVDHSSLLGTLPSGGYGYCGGYYDGAVRRGVFFENVVYSISYGGIIANDVADLATPLASLSLEAPTLPGLSACAEPTGGAVQ